MEEDQGPDVSTLAQASESAYSDTVPRNYLKVNELSTPDISTYKHETNPHYIVAHRGTDLHSDTKNKQIKADLNILLGNTNQSKLHKERTKKTEEIVRAIKEKDPEHKIHLTGHSLGGHTAHHAMVKSPYVRENVTSLNTFNAGSSPLQSKGIAKSNKAYSTIARKSTHHRIAGDEISASVKSNLIGSHKTYKNKQKPSLGKVILNIAEPLLTRSPLGKLVHFGATKLVDTLSSHSLKNFIKK